MLWWSKNIRWTRPTMYSEDLEYILWTLPFLKRFSMKTKARWWTAKPEIVTIYFNSCWLFVMYLKLEPIRRSRYTWRIKRKSNTSVSTHISKTWSHYEVLDLIKKLKQLKLGSLKIWRKCPSLEALWGGGGGSSDLFTENHTRWYSHIFPT